MIRQGIDEGVFREGDPKVLGFCIVGAINFLPQWFSSKGPFSREEIKKMIREYLMRGILKSAKNEEISRRGAGGRPLRPRRPVGR